MGYTIMFKHSVPKSLSAAAVLALAAAAFAGNPKAIRLGFTGNKYDKPYTTGIPGFVQEKQALEQEFAKEGIKIEWSFFKGTGPAVNEAVANGKLDIAGYGDLPTLIGRAGGLPTKVIIPSSVLSGKNYVLVNVNSSFRNLADLKGKRITFQKGTYLHLLWDRLVRAELGLKEKDFKIYSLTGGDQEVALASGSADAFLGTSLDLVDRGVARILYTIDFEKNPELSNFGNIVATESFIKDHPDLVQRVVNAYVRVAKEVLLKDSREEFVRIGTKNGTSERTSRLNLTAKLEFAYAPVFDAYYYQRLQASIDDAKEWKLIRKAVDPKDWVDARFLDKAVRDEGLEERWTALRKVGDVSVR